MTTTAKTPEDHKAKPQQFTFDAAGKTYKLPFASKGAERVSGRYTRDALMGGDAEQLKLGFAMLEACGVGDATVDALYSLPTPEMLEILGNWMSHGDGDGASVPQS